MAEEPQPAAWFNVRYGEAETALFNADCWAVVLLDYIKERCGYSALDEPVEMAQMEEEFALIEQVEALAGKLSIAKIKRFIVAEGGELPAGRAKKARYVRMAVEVASRRSWGDAKAKLKKALSTSAADIGVSAQ